MTDEQIQEKLRAAWAKIPVRCLGCGHSGMLPEFGKPHLSFHLCPKCNGRDLEHDKDADERGTP